MMTPERMAKDLFLWHIGKDKRTTLIQSINTYIDANNIPPHTCIHCLKPLSYEAPYHFCGDRKERQAYLTDCAYAFCEEHPDMVLEWITG